MLGGSAAAPGDVKRRDTQRGWLESRIGQAHRLSVPAAIAGQPRMFSAAVAGSPERFRRLTQPPHAAASLAPAHPPSHPERLGFCFRNSSAFEHCFELRYSNFELLAL